MIELDLEAIVIHKCEKRKLTKNNHNVKNSGPMVQK